jgi:regulator of protease activity HflC (stomatin/prohibitin superfamily)
MAPRKPRSKGVTPQYVEPQYTQPQPIEKDYSFMKFLATAGAVILTVLFAVYFTSLSKVPAGNVGVKVYLLGSSKGVDSEEVGPGRYWVGWNEDLFLFPTFTQNYVWTRDPDETGNEDESISFQTSEGMTVNADVGISYAIQPGKANDIFQKYRKGVTEITDIYLRNMVRDALVTEASTKPVETVYGAGKAQLMEAVEKRVRSQVEPLGIMIERIYWIGTVRLPEKVIESLNAKIQATQMAAQRRNEVEQAKAEADKKIEDARGQAESIRLVAEAQAAANEKIAKSLTDELVQYKSIEKWDGIMPRMTGGALPFINMDLESARKSPQ